MFRIPTQSGEEHPAIPYIIHDDIVRFCSCCENKLNILSDANRYSSDEQVCIDTYVASAARAESAAALVISFVGTRGTNMYSCCPDTASSIWLIWESLVKYVITLFG
jgi:hypothetical protein